MVPTVTDIEHEPFSERGKGRENIDLDDDSHIHLTADGNHARITRMTGMLSTDRVTDPDVIESIIEDVTDQLPDDVERTARRILQVDAWIREHDVTRAADVNIPIHGQYRPLRRSDQSLVLIEETTERTGQRELPVVAAVDNEDFDCGKKLQKLLNATVERLTERSMGSQVETHFRDDLNRQAVATKWRVVESLDDAETIVCGDAPSAKGALTSY